VVTKELLQKGDSLNQNIQLFQIDFFFSDFTNNPESRVKTFTPAQAAPGATPDEAARQTRGKIGEQHVMSRLYRVPGTAVYWNVGIDFGERRCELDHLVLTPEGIILVECKNLRGTWKAVGDDDHPNQWARVDSNEKQIHSPFSQAHRAGGILVELLKRIGVFLPVQKVIVFVDSSIHISGIRDSRALCCFLDGLPSTVENARAALKEGGKVGHPLDVLHFMAFLAKEGLLPAFYDQRLLLTFINPSNPASVDTEAILRAIFNQSPCEGFSSLAVDYRPKVIVQEAFNDTVRRILASFTYQQIQEELRRPATGMALPAEVWEQQLARTTGGE
jgi:hypothetical protein